MFVRFVVGGDADDHRALTGVVASARGLRDQGELQTDQVLWLEALFDWFNFNLSVPPFQSKKLSGDCVSWFKHDAEVHIKKMRELCALLSDHGVAVRMLRSKRPGKIVYEDDYQVVVEEWRTL